MPDVQEAYRSPVDGTIISSRKHLREHNHRNDVVHLHEFGTTQEIKDRYAKAQSDLHHGRNKQDRKERLKDVIEAVNEVEQRGNN